MTRKSPTYTKGLPREHAPRPAVFTAWAGRAGAVRAVQFCRRHLKNDQPTSAYRVEKADGSHEQIELCDACASPEWLRGFEALRRYRAQWEAKKEARHG